MSRGKGLAFIFDNEKIQEFLKSIQSDKEIIIVCKSNDIKTKLVDLGIECKTFNEYSHDTEEELQKSIDWIKTWPDKKISNNKTFKELLVYDDLSIYWFLEARLYFYRIQELILLIESLRKIISIENPDSIWVKGSKDANCIVSELCKGIIQKFELSQKNESERDIKYKSYQGFPTLKLLLLKLFRGLYVNSSEKSSSKEKRPILVISELGGWRREMDYDSQKQVERDVFFHNIVKKLSDLGNYVKIIDFENKPQRLLNAYLTNKKRQRGFGVRVEPWEKYISFDIIKKSKEANNRFMKMWQELKNSEDLKKSLVYDGISLYELLVEDLDYLFKSFKAYTAVTFIEVARKILEIERPSAIVMHDEYGALQLSLIKAAKKNGVPTISLQHGLSSDGQVQYIHKPEHVANQNSDLSFPLPDKMCVWSQSAKKNLIELGNFPSSILTVTGDPKLDFLPKVVKKFNFEDIIKKLEIPKNKKIILFATENLPKKEENVLITKTILKTMKELPNCHLVIKIHPNELDFSLYREIAKKVNLSKFSLFRDVNLYELLYVSDVVIVSYSTVGVEAMRMKKPVIALHLMGLHDNVSYIKQNMAYVIRSEEELLATIKKSLESENVENKIEKAKVFSEQELGPIDSKATEKIVQLILELKNEKQGISSN